MTRNAPEPTEKKPSAALHRPIDMKAFLICVALSMIWGMQQTAIKAAGPDISPMLQVGVRSLASACLLLLANKYCLKEKWNWNVRLRDACLIALGFIGEFFFVAEGLRFTTASHMSVLLYTAPFFAAVGLSIRLPEERLAVLQWAGLFVAFSGIVVAFLLPAVLAGQGASGDLWILGDFLGLMSGVSWGFTTIFMRTTTMNDAAPTQMLFTQLAGAALILTPLAFLTGQDHFAGTPVAWASLLFQIFVVSFASYLVWCQLIKVYLAARLGVLVFMTPFFGVLFSVMLLGESIGAFFVCGSLLMLAGLLMVQAKGASLLKRRKG